MPRLTYGRVFWLAFAANGLVLMAVALLYHYADFVTLLGGTDFHLGWIVGIGMIGSLVMRLSMGTWIDRYGTRTVWLASTVLFAVACLAHLLVTSHSGVAIYALRILYCSALAGIFAASMTFIAACGPVERMAELYGMLGTATFVGIVAGTLLGDRMFGSVAVQRSQIVGMFVGAAVLSLLSFPLVWLATRNERRPKRAAAQDPWGVLRRHPPGMILVVSVAMGMALALPGTFLRPFANELSIPRIGVYFTAFSIAAIATRMLSRRWCERFGLKPMIVLGLLSLAASVAMFLLVRVEWQLAIPAITFGCGQAILWPAVMAAGCISFPAANRGFATFLVLALADVGQLVGAPFAGVLLRVSRANSIQPYPTTFLAFATILALVSIWYAIVGRRPREPVVTAGGDTRSPSPEADSSSSG